MLSQAVGYAASAMGYVAAAGGKPVLVKEIAGACEIPGPYLAKIVHQLSKAGLVRTQRGIGGGVTLARPAADISLFAVCEVLGDPAIERRCMLSSTPCCDERSCPAHKFWAPQRERQIEFLKQTTMADIAVFETRRRWTRVKSTPSSPATPEAVN
jgi:Rrf2 family protein